MTVEELVRAAAGGDCDAFEQLVRLYEKSVRAGPADVRQSGGRQRRCTGGVFVRMAGTARLSREAGFSTWLYRLTSNAAIDLLRKKKHQRGEMSLDDEEAPLDLPDQSPGPQASAEGAEVRNAVNAGLQALSEDHRQVLVLREYQELSYEEIAEVLDVDLGTVKSRISRARSALRKILLKSGNLSGYLPSKQAESRKEGRS